MTTKDVEFDESLFEEWQSESQRFGVRLFERVKLSKHSK